VFFSFTPALKALVSAKFSFYPIQFLEGADAGVTYSFFPEK
jgi:hypothetical protein